MGQKVNPHGLRVGIIKGWDTQWFAEKKDFSKYLKEDHEIREYIKKTYFQAAISRVTIDRVAQKVIINIFTSRPAVLIGKSGAGVEQMKKEIAKIARDKNIIINIREVRKPDANAQLLAESIAAQIEKRVSFRRAMKQALGRAARSGVKGVKVMVSGRLGGAEIARSEHYQEGSIPLQTLRADIDYGFAEAFTTYGVIGIKCWIYHGEVLGKQVLHREGGDA
ncbi:MAG: 30S ribosomal protein S3 [Clostridiales bacterium]|jgi:small subunit ribosomal protein S3|nr:30S ribosomal protein S3 [Clostridiales bacterium]